MLTDASSVLHQQLAEPRALHRQSAFQAGHRKSKRQFAQVTRAESDFQKPANTGEFIILELRGTEPEDLVTVKNMQPYAHS